MIITSLQGGLGNQMFQYAMGKVWAIKVRTELKLDKTNLSQGIPPREYELKIFTITEDFASDSEIRKLKPPENFLTRKSPKFHNFLGLIKKTYLSELFLKGKVPAARDNKYLDGYWQSEDYFKDHQTEIRQSFTFKNKTNSYTASWLKKIQHSPSVSVHVRRTDYVNRGGRAPIIGCSLNYYFQAMSIIRQKLGKKASLYVFSDDIEWCQKNINFAGFDIKWLSSHDQNDHNSDLELMSKCDHNIIANSSFSWWGAWLNKNPKKIVIAPDPWLENSINKLHNTVPNDWIKIPKM